MHDSVLRPSFPLELVVEELRHILPTGAPAPVDSKRLPCLRRAPPAPLRPSPAPQPEYRIIAGPPGNAALEIMIVDPHPGRTGRPALLHMHGGGFVMGSLRGAAAKVQDYARGADCLVVSVGYRLAPETRFGGALDDALVALAWLHENAPALGVDRRRIGVGGESAGGCHATTLAIAARDRGGPPIAFLFLIYPMLDDRTGTVRTAPPGVGQFVWTAQDNAFGWSALLGCPPGGHVPHGAVPARVRNLRGLPPTFIAAAALDLFVGENLEFARKLRYAGVPVDLYVEPGAYHGFNVLVPNAVASRRFDARVIAGLRLLSGR